MIKPKDIRAILADLGSYEVYTKKQYGLILAEMMHVITSAAIRLGADKSVFLGVVSVAWDQANNEIAEEAVKARMQQLGLTAAIGMTEKQMDDSGLTKSIMDNLASSQPDKGN